MIAATKGRPMVVRPSVRSSTRGLAASSFWKYSITWLHCGSLRSAPGSNPITDAGVGTCASTTLQASSMAASAARNESLIP